MSRNINGVLCTSRWKQVLSYRSRLMELPRERLLSRGFEVDECDVQNSWSAHVVRWLDARAARHAHITGCSPDALYTTQVSQKGQNPSEFILRYKNNMKLT